MATASSSSLSGSSVETARAKHGQGRLSGPARRSKKGGWTEEEDTNLIRAVEFYKGKNWKKIAESFPGRTDVQCLHRWQKVLNPDLVKGPWRKEEDDLIIELVARYGCKKWSIIAQSLPGRIGKQCRERWHNHLNPAITKDAWTEAEEVTLIRAHQIYGNKWAEIAKFLPGRADNSIKNHWNCSVKKKLASYVTAGLLGQVPITHNFQSLMKVGENVASGNNQTEDTLRSADDRAGVVDKALCLGSSILNTSSGKKRHIQSRISEFPGRALSLVHFESANAGTNPSWSSHCSVMQTHDPRGNLALRAEGRIADSSCRGLASHPTSTFSSPSPARPNRPPQALTYDREATTTRMQPLSIMKPLDSLEAFQLPAFAAASGGGTHNGSSPTRPSLVLQPFETCDHVRAGTWKTHAGTPPQLEHPDCGRLCYEPPSSTSWNSPLSSYRPSKTDLQPVLNADCSTPSSTLKTFQRGSSPESILRNAARTYSNTPSILRKRRHSSVRVLPIESQEIHPARVGDGGAGTPETNCRGSSSSKGSLCFADCSTEELPSVKKLVLSPQGSLRPEKVVAVKSVEKCLESAFNEEWKNANAKCTSKPTANNSILANPCKN